MNEEFVLNLGIEALKIALFLGAPVLIVAMLVGILVSIIQAVTQINEATLTFVPKIIAISIVLLITGPWMLELITNYTTELILKFPEFVRM